MTVAADSKHEERFLFRLLVHLTDRVRSEYMQQRYYDPMLGVFLSVDPVTAYEQPISQFHRYRYANNNPYRFKDPDGRYSCEGSKQDCAKVDQYVSKVRDASRSRDLKPGERARVRAVSNYLGKKGEGGPKITPPLCRKTQRPAQISGAISRSMSTKTSRCRCGCSRRDGLGA